MPVAGHSAAGAGIAVGMRNKTTVGTVGVLFLNCQDSRRENDEFHHCVDLNRDRL